MGSSAAGLPRHWRATEICRVRVVGRMRRIGQNFAHRVGAEFYPCLLDDRDALGRAIEGSFLVIHAAGPFQGADYHVAEQCLEGRARIIWTWPTLASLSPASAGSTTRPASGGSDGRLGSQLDSRDHVGDDRGARRRSSPGSTKSTRLCRREIKTRVAPPQSRRC